MRKEHEIPYSIALLRDYCETLEEILILKRIFDLLYRHEHWYRNYLSHLNCWLSSVMRADYTRLKLLESVAINSVFYFVFPFRATHEIDKKLSLICIKSISLRQMPCVARPCSVLLPWPRRWRHKNANFVAAGFKRDIDGDMRHWQGARRAQE